MNIKSRLEKLENTGKGSVKLHAVANAEEAAALEKTLVGDSSYLIIETGIADGMGTLVVSSGEDGHSATPALC